MNIWPENLRIENIRARAVEAPAPMAREYATQNHLFLDVGCTCVVTCSHQAVHKHGLCAGKVFTCKTVDGKLHVTRIA